MFKSLLIKQLHRFSRYDYPLQQLVYQVRRKQIVRYQCRLVTYLDVKRSLIILQYPEHILVSLVSINT
jgi:hypothetical protein